MTNICPDCNGSGEYLGFNIAPEPCQTCNGHGKLDENGEPLQSILPSNLPDWMNDPHYIEQLDVTHKISNTSSKLAVGDVVYVYNLKWYEGRITYIDNTSLTILYYDGRGPSRLAAPIDDICWNVTQSRWECIFIGKPTW